jgi:hypothetical protein
MVLWTILVIIYFLPFICAMIQRRRRAGAIGILNLFLGWTLIGWVAAAIWASFEDQPLIAAPQIIVTAEKEPSLFHF